MFTKKMALEAAFEILKKGHSKEAVMRRIAAETQSLLSTIPNGVYSDAIRLQQIDEIDLRIDHYCNLMRAEGNDYAALVGHVYPTKPDYMVYHNALTAAERKVTRAARETLGSQTDDEMADRIETATDIFRQQEVEAIYGPHARR
jgi:hypothetical protein